MLAQSLIVLVVRRTQTTQNIHILVRQLERGCFKPNRAGRVGEYESKVNVNDVAFAVHQDISVVSILELQDIRDDAVCCQ